MNGKLTFRGLQKTRRIAAVRKTTDAFKTIFTLQYTIKDCKHEEQLLHR